MHNPCSITDMVATEAGSTKQDKKRKLKITKLGFSQVHFPVDTTNIFYIICICSNI